MWIGSALLAFALLCGGCQTSKQALFSATDPGWKVSQGQALWQPRRDLPEIAGDLVFATHPDGRCVIEFAKPPMPMMFAQVMPGRWLVRFPAQDLGFAGRGRPSKRFAWLYLPAALAGQELPSSLLFTREADGGWRLENKKSGETLRGFLEQ